MPANEKWLNRFVEVQPISSNGAFRITAGRDSRSARHVVVVTPDRAADLAASRIALTRLHHAHSTVKHITVAPAIYLDVDSDLEPHVVFDIPAKMNLKGLLGVCRRKPEHRVEHAEGDAFTYYLREGLSEAHQHAAPWDGAPICVGPMCHSGIVFARDGRFWLIGLGHNIAACDEHGQIDGRAVFAPPEVLLGHQATPIGDYISLLKLGRSVMEFSRLAPGVMAVVSGRDSNDSSVALAELMMWVESRVLGATVSQRATVAEAVDVANRIREILDCQPDLDGFQTAVARAFNSASECMPSGAPESGWQIANDGSWLARDGVRKEVKSKPIQRILVKLLEMREESPGSKISVEETFAVGWPGERVRTRAAANRVYVAINGLRGLGLGSDLESKRGYSLSLAVPWRWESLPDQ